MTEPTRVVPGRLGDGQPSDETAWQAQHGRLGAHAQGSDGDVIDEAQTSEFVTAVDERVDEEPAPRAGLARSRFGRGIRPNSRLRAVSTATAGTWLGVLLVAVGFGTIFYTWGKVAGVVNVAQQLPYVVSGGVTGLALVIVGVAVVDIAVRKQDGDERRHQLAQMSRTLDELHGLLDTTTEPSDEYDDRGQRWER